MLGAFCRFAARSVGELGLGALAELLLKLLDHLLLPAAKKERGAFQRHVIAYIYIDR